MIHYQHCPLCSSGQIVQYLKSADFFLTGEEYDLIKCESCGLVFTQDRPDEENMGKYYDSTEYASHNASKGLLNLLYRFARNVMLRLKSYLIIRLTGRKRGALLDIGSGSGHFLAKMRNAGWEVKGIEINDKAREASSLRFGIEVFHPDQLAFFKAESFDCITFWHVLEHLNDPEYHLKNAMRLLKPGGCCIVALPNCNSLDAEHYKKYWAAYDVPRHFWHFTPDSFSFLARNVKCEVSSVKKLPADVFYISVLSEKYRGKKFYAIPGFLKGLWFTILSANRKERSSSLIYVLLKKRS